MARVEPGSPSLTHPEYWWYRTREDLLRRGLSQYVGLGSRILDVGSADGPSVGWLRDRGHRVGMDIDARGLDHGDVCGSALDLPFRSEAFHVVAGFDVLEHCNPEGQALDEFRRVLVPGGVLLLSVPAYQWAWTSHDDLNHHHRRYTRARAIAAVEGHGFSLLRASYMFTGTLPAFATNRLLARVKERRQPVAPSGPPPLPEISKVQERILSSLTAVDRRLIDRYDLPWGSSVILAATKPESANGTVT